MTLRPRAFWIGAVLVALLGVCQPYIELVLRSFYTGLGSLPAAPVVALLLLVTLGGWSSAQLGPRFSLTRAELLLIYTMLLVAAQLPHGGGLPYILSTVVYPHYFGSPASEVIPRFLRLNDPAANQWFYQGLPAGTSIPWLPWLVPLAAWTLFALLMYAAFFSLSALLRRDWIEGQRLAFPLAELPLAMVTPSSSSPAESIFHSWRLWIGFGAAFALVTLQWVQSLVPAIPALTLHWEVGKSFENLSLPWNVLSDMSLNLDLAVIGVILLVPGEVALSLWLFYVLYRLQLIGYAAAGLSGSEGSQLFAPVAFIHHQEAGGFIMLAVALLGHSRRAIRRAFVRTGSSPESPRWPLWVFLGSNAGLALWAAAAGAQVWAFLLIMLIYYIVALGITRLVSAGGVMFVDTGFFPRGLLTSAFGAAPFSAGSLTLFTQLQTIFFADPMFCMMPYQMTGLRLAQAGRISDRRITLAMAGGILVMVAVGFPALLWVTYHHGAASFNRWPLTSYAQWQFNELGGLLQSPPKPSEWTALGLSTGALIMGFLIQMHQRFLWWGVSPIGYIIASSYETNRSLWANALVGWLIGTLLRRYGGLRLYAAWRPAFIGLILGSFVGGAITSVLAAILGVTVPSG